MSSSPPFPSIFNAHDSIFSALPSIPVYIFPFITQTSLHLFTVQLLPISKKPRSNNIFKVPCQSIFIAWWLRRRGSLRAGEQSRKRQSTAPRSWCGPERKQGTRNEITYKTWCLASEDRVKAPPQVFTLKEHCKHLVLPYMGQKTHWFHVLHTAFSVHWKL